MKRRQLRVWIGVPAMLVLVLGALIAESSDMPILLPLGIVGLGSLTMASERWRAAHPDAGELPALPDTPCAAPEEDLAA